MRGILWPVFSVLCVCLSAVNSFRINLSGGKKDFELNRFWTSTGFCPGGLQETVAVLNSDDVVQNLILLSSLPRNGLQYVRIHWILDLISINPSSSTDNPLSYNFTHLDKLYDLHQSLNLLPHVEFMRSSPFGRQRGGIKWRDLVLQFLQHFIHRYSLKEINRWRFETWNEPDLAMYNRMNWTSAEEYFHHISAVKSAFTEVRRRYPNFQGELRGPAGTFKSPDHHPFCYGVLDECQKNVSGCPFDILSFHRKGTTGKAKQILKGEIELLKDLETRYPFLKTRMWSNSEADPTTGWSLPMKSNTGIEYAREIVSNIFYHWTALNRGHSGRRLESISQDNAFLSYHPFEFSQRTLFARFQMNMSIPRHSEFVQKPSFAALGFLANLGSRADLVRRMTNGLTILKTTSRSESYYSILMVGARNAKQKLNVNFTGLDTKKSFGVLVEVLEKDGKDAFSIWQRHGAPPYPTAELLDEMRRGQSPKIFYSGGPMGSYLKIQGNFQPPYLMLVRLCDKRTLDKWSFGNVTFHLVTERSAIVRWEVMQKSFNCIKGFQVFFREAAVGPGERPRKWQEITMGQHVPWHSFQFQAKNSSSVYGDYKVKAIEIFRSKHSSRFTRVFPLRRLGEQQEQQQV